MTKGRMSFLVLEFLEVEKERDERESEWEERVGEEREEMDWERERGRETEEWLKVEKERERERGREREKEGEVEGEREDALKCEWLRKVRTCGIYCLRVLVTRRLKCGWWSNVRKLDSKSVAKYDLGVEEWGKWAYEEVGEIGDGGESKGEREEVDKEADGKRGAVWGVERERDETESGERGDLANLHAERTWEGKRMMERERVGERERERRERGERKDKWLRLMKQSNR
jgi:hypothetical protein